MTPHRNQSAYPSLWSGIEGAIRDAMNMHPDIQIPERRVSSIVKRAVGYVLAHEARAARAAETVGGAAPTPSADGSLLRPSEGAVHLGGRAHIPLPPEPHNPR